MVCRGDGRHTALLLSSLSHGNILEATPDATTELDVVWSAAMALLTNRPADRTAVANFIVTDYERTMLGWMI